MKTFSALWLALVLFAQPLIADTIPAPEEVLARAKEGRAPLVEAVSDLTRLISDVDNETDLFGYLRMVGPLEAIAKEYDFASTGADPVKTLSVVITRQGAKWMFLDSAPWDVFEFFMRRAEDTTRYEVIGFQTNRIQRETDKAKLLKWHAQVGKLSSLVETLRSTLPLVDRVDELQSLTLKKILGLKDLTQAEMTRLVRETKTRTSISEAIASLGQKIHQSKDAKELDSHLFWMTLLKGNLEAIKGSISSAAYQEPGTWILLAVERITSVGKAPGLVNASEVVGALSDSQAGELAQTLSSLFSVDPPEPGAFEFVWSLSVRLAERFERAGNAHRLKVFQTFQQSLAGLRVVNSEVFEGTYNVTIGEGTPVDPKQEAILTLAAVGSSNFILGLNVLFPKAIGSQYGLDYNFFDVVWDVKNGRYVAQYRAVESPKFLFRPEDHYQMKFTLERTPDGKSLIHGTFFDGSAPARFRKLEGELFEAYPTYTQMTLPQPLDDFTGIFNAAKGSPEPDEVIVTKTGASVGGKYFWDPYLSDVPFEWGYYNALRNTIYLTTGEFAGARKWTHLRGQLSADGTRFEVVYVMSGRGIQKRFELVKTN